MKVLTRMFCSILSVVILLSFSACSGPLGGNKFTVTVERMDVPNYPSPLPREPEQSLLRVQKTCIDFHEYLAGLPDKFAESLIKAVNVARARKLTGEKAKPLGKDKEEVVRKHMRDQLEPELNRLKCEADALAQQGASLLEESKKLYDPNFQLTYAVPGGPYSLQATMIHAYRISANEYFSQTRRFFVDARGQVKDLLAKQEKKNQRIINVKPGSAPTDAPEDSKEVDRPEGEDSDGIHESKTALDEMLAGWQVKSNESLNAVNVAVNSSFGGMRVMGVFIIDPADPAYATVLKPTTRWHEFARASSTTAGDSNIIIVFDDPVRPRTFQLQNDPSQLIRNVVGVIDMAVQAVAKYATVPG